MSHLLLKMAALAGLVSTFLLAHPAAAQVLQRYNTGTWTIEANAQSGSFQNCSARGSYGGGASVLFMLTRNMVWGVAITNPNWNWRIGSRGPVNYWVDGGAVRRGTATASAASRLIIPLADSTSLFNEIRGGHRLYFRPDGNPAFNMTLRGTSVALSELIACVQKFR